MKLDRILCLVRIALAGMCLLLGSRVETQAQYSAVVEQQRFAEILKEMDDNSDQLIDREELSRFLKKNADKILATLEKTGIKASVVNKEKFDDFLDQETITIFNNLNPNAATHLGANEIRGLEAQRLDPPFSGTIKDLLPVPQIVVEPQPVTQKPSKTLIETVGPYFRIRRSFLDDQFIGRPATITLNHYGSQDNALKQGRAKTNLSFQGAIAVEPFGYRNTEVGMGSMLPLPGFRREKLWFVWTPVLVYEADVSTDSNASRNQIIHRVGFQGTLYTEEVTRGLSGHNFAMTFDYTTDRDYKSALLGGTLQHSLNIRALGIGEFLPLWKVGRLEPYVSWRPYWGLAFADVQDPGNNETLQKNSDYTNGLIRGGLELALTERLLFTPEFSFYKEFMNKEEDHLFYSISGRYIFYQEKDRQFSLELSYERGEKSPDFVEQELTKLSLGIKF